MYPLIYGSSFELDSRFPQVVHEESEEEKDDKVSNGVSRVTGGAVGHVVVVTGGLS